MGALRPLMFHIQVSLIGRFFAARRKILGARCVREYKGVGDNCE
jgi:hypothetical protein